MVDQTGFFHLDFANEDHIQVEHMKYEVRTHHEEQLVLAVEAHARDLT